MSMYGRIQYVLSTSDAATPQRSPHHLAEFYGANTLPWTATLNPGDTQDIYLDWGYDNLDEVRASVRTASFTPIGFSEVVSHGHRTNRKFSVSFVAHIRQAGMVDDYAVLQAFNDHMEAGSAVWWPDYDNFPTESVTIVCNKITAPSRQITLGLFSFSFDVAELPSGQAPTTVPPFV